MLRKLKLKAERSFLDCLKDKGSCFFSFKDRYLKKKKFQNMTEELKLNKKIKRQWNIQPCFWHRVNKCSKKPCPCPNSKGTLRQGPRQGCFVPSSLPFSPVLFDISRAFGIRDRQMLEMVSSLACCDVPLFASSFPAQTLPLFFTR